MNWLAVFIGGGLGSLLRFWISRRMIQFELDFAWATFVANLVSSIFLGILMGYIYRGDLGGQWSFFWMVGFCGGFSTFSTFTAETFVFLQNGQWGHAVLNVVLSVMVCLLGFFLGVKLIS